MAGLKRYQLRCQIVKDYYLKIVGTKTFGTVTTLDTSFPGHDNQHMSYFQSSPQCTQSSTLMQHCFCINFSM